MKGKVGEGHGRKIKEGGVAGGRKEGEGTKNKSNKKGGGKERK